MVAAGSPFWFEIDPAVPELNTKIDLGTLRAIDDELEVQLEWPMSPGLRMAIQSQEPSVMITDGSRLFATERVVCTTRGAMHFETLSRLVGPDGGELRRRDEEPAAARAQAEESFSKQHLDSYGRDPRSLVCWAVARKCGGEAVTWPPPPNRTPLEYSERADRMRAEYNALFIPKCGLR